MGKRSRIQDGVRVVHGLHWVLVARTELNKFEETAAGEEWTGLEFKSPGIRRMIYCGDVDAKVMFRLSLDVVVGCLRSQAGKSDHGYVDKLTGTRPVCNGEVYVQARWRLDWVFSWLVTFKIVVEEVEHVHAKLLTVDCEVAGKRVLNLVELHVEYQRTRKLVGC